MPRTTTCMCLILRRMSDAFQLRRRAAVAVAAAIATLAPGCGPSGPPPPKSEVCVIDLGALAVHGCSLLKSDTATAPNPRPLWGQIDCQNDSRHQRTASGGDPHPTGGGRPQPD